MYVCTLYIKTLGANIHTICMIGVSSSFFLWLCVHVSGRYLCIPTHPPQEFSRGHLEIRTVLRLGTSKPHSIGFARKRFVLHFRKNLFSYYAKIASENLQKLSRKYSSSSYVVIFYRYAFYVIIE